MMQNLKKLVKSTTYVAVDLETSGLGYDDHIIEVGAVKIADGEITEKFHTFVACPVKLPPEVVLLTGIKDEDLYGAPPVEKALKELHLFCEGCIIVAHNLPFDYSFMKKYGDEFGIFFDNPQIDTLVMARARLKNADIANYKLYTLANYFNIEFRHHRALDDAETTAKIFLDLAKL